MAWTTPKTWTASETVEASELNTHLRDNLNETAPGVATAAGNLIVTDAANSITERTPDIDTVLTSETTTSTTFTDLATSGPAVTVTTGTAALVIITGELSNNTGLARTYMSVTVSGATASSAANNRSLMHRQPSGVTTAEIQASHAVLFTALTAGSNTFTAKYRVSAGTGTFSNRRILVIPF